jgi:hypothetical protein
MYILDSVPDAIEILPMPLPLQIHEIIGKSMSCIFSRFMSDTHQTIRVAWEDWSRKFQPRNDDVQNYELQLTHHKFYLKKPLCYVLTRPPLSSDVDTESRNINTSRINPTFSWPMVCIVYVT